MSAALAHVGRGFAQPVHHAQQTFRAVLEAMSRPGRVQTLPATALAGLELPRLSPVTTALLLTLLDAETTLHLAPSLASTAAADHLRFHTGVRLLPSAAAAAFVAVAAPQATAGLWMLVDGGTDESPQAGATLVVEVPVLREAAAAEPGTLVLRGPGIERTHRLHAGGLSAAFWQARTERQADYPRGIDLILCCGQRLAALPRTTLAALEG